MKRKIIIGLLAICTAICGVFGLSACFNSNRPVLLDSMEFSLTGEGNYVFEGDIDSADIIPDTYILRYVETAELDGKTLNIPSEVNGKPVTGVTAEFSGCGVKSVVFPDSVKFITSSFSNCEKLESVTLPKGIKSLCRFEGCTSLQSINIPDGVTKIYYETFARCTSLQSINFPEGLTEIGESAFDGCTSLQDINFPDKLTRIGQLAFKDCASIKSVIIPDSVKRIDDMAFSGCTALETLVLPDIQYDPGNGLGNATFEGCKIKDITASADNFNEICFDKSELENVVICGGEVISDNMFSLIYDSERADYQFTGLPLSVTLPSTIKQIGYSEYSNVFSNRKNITLNFPDENTLYGIDFTKNWNGYYEYSYTDEYGYERWKDVRCNIQLNINGEPVNDLFIPADVEKLSANMFNGFANLKSFTVAEDNANYFAQDNILYNKAKTEILCVPEWISGAVTIPYGITSIKDQFKKENGEVCELTELHFPDSVTSFNEGALRDCLMLESLTVPFASLTKDGSNRSFSSLFYRPNSSVFDPKPMPKNLTINSGEYYDNYFYNNSGNTQKVENLVLGDGVTSISGGGFPELRTLTIGKNVTSINLSASRLVEIYNLSDIDIEKGSAGVGRNALGIYTSLDVESKVKTTDNGYTVFEDGDDVYLLGYNGTEENLVLPEKLNGKNYSIHNYAFYYGIGYISSDPADRNGYLKSIVIPDGVKTIGANAFYGQQLLEEVQFGTGITEIGDSAFYACQSLKTVELPNIEKIGNNTFLYCDDLETLILGNSLKEMGDYVFTYYGSPHNISNVTAPAEAFAYIPKNKLKTVNITGGTVIPVDAFYHCTTLETVTIADTVTEIGNYAFNGCSNITSITVPDSVTKIGTSVFTGCTGLSANSVGGVNYVGKFVVSCDPEVTSVTIKEGTTQILENAFENSAVVSVIIPDSVIFIGQGAFKNCASLTSVKISDKVTAINAETFYGCVKLTSLTSAQSARAAEQGINIPDSVKSIESNAFYGCSDITGIVIPDETELGNNVFYGCNQIESAVMPASAISQINVKYNLKTVVITSGDSIEQGAFSGANSLESITLPFIGGGKSGTGNIAGMFGYIFGTGYYYGSVEAEQQHTFTNYNGQYTAFSTTFYLPATLTDVTITGGYTYDGCFSGCTNIKNITFGENCDFSYIEMRTFYGCTSLESFTVPDSVEVIEQEAFSGCESLAEINLNNTCFIRGLVFENCTSLESVFIPRAVVTLAPQVFQGCTSLSSVSFALSDWARVTESGTSSGLDVSDAQQNAVNLRGSWLNYSLANVTRLQEYYK